LTVLALLLLTLAAPACAADLTVSRTLTIQQYVRVYFEPLKADGTTIGLIDSSDHPVVWKLDGVALGSGMTETGVVRINHGAETCDVHAGGPDGDGPMTLLLSATGDADMTPGQVRDVTWSVELNVTVLPNEAVTGSGRVSEPINIF
jgi:hypothetical protein